MDSEGFKGSITVGKLADLTVFSKNLMTMPEADIPSTRVLYTIVGGTIQYAANDSAAGASPR